MAATLKRQRVLFTHEPQTPANRLPTINLIEATPSTPSSSTSSAPAPSTSSTLAPRTVGGRPSVRVVPRNAKTPSRLPVPVSKRPTTGAVHHASAIPETPPPLIRPSMAENSTQDGRRPLPAKIPVKPHKRALKPLHLLQRAAEAKRRERNNTPDPPDSPGFVEVGIADTPPSDPSANPSLNSSISHLAPPLDDPDISEVVIIPKLKKRPGLDYDWARGGAPAPESKPTKGKDTGRPASVRIPDKTSWWSTLGRGRKKEKDNENAERGSLRSLLRSRATSTEPESDTQSPRRRTNTLTGALLLVLPKPHVDAATDTSNLPPTTSQESLHGARAPKSRNGTASSVVSTSNRSDAPSEGTVKNGSLALRAMRSVRSLASVWGRNGSTKEKEGKESKKRNGSQVSVASGSFSATEALGAPRKRGATLNANGLPVAPVAPGAGRHTAARAGPSRKQNATTDLTRQSSDTFSAESSGSHRVSGASILSTGRSIRFSTDSPVEVEVAKNADAYAGCTFVNQDPDEDATRTSRTSKSSTSIRWSEHVLEAEREKAKRKNRDVMRRVSAPLSMFSQTNDEEKMPNIEPKKRAPLAGLFDLHIPSPSSSQVEFSPIDEQCRIDYRSSSQRRWSMADLDPSQSSRRPSTSDYIDPDVQNEGSIRSSIIPRPRTASEIFLDRIRPSSMFEPDLRESDSALPYLSATASDLESLVEDPESPYLTPNGTLFKSTRRGAIAHSGPLDAHSSDESLRDSLRASTMTVRPSKTTKTPPPGRLILPEPQVDQNPDSDLVGAEPIVDLFESEPSSPAPAPDSPVFARLTAPPVRRPSAGLLERVVAWRSANKESKEPETPIAPVRNKSVLQPKQRPATDEATPQLSGFRIRPGIVSRAVSIFDTTSDTASTQRAPVRPLRLKRASIVSQGHSSTANSSSIPSPSDRTFGESPDRSVSGYLEEDEGYPSQPRLPSRKISVRERVASIDKLAQISNGLENLRTRGRVSPEDKQDLGSLGSMDSEVQEDGLDDDDESVLGSDIPDDLRAELSSQASPPLRFEDLSSSLTERRSTGLLPPHLTSSQVRVEEELYSSWASRPSFDFSAEIARVGLDKHLLGDLKASFADLMDDADDETAHIRSEHVGLSRADAYDAGQDLQAVLRSGPSKRVEAPGSTWGPKDLATLRPRGPNHALNETASLRSTQSSLVWRASLSSRLSAGRASSDDNVSLALSFKIAPIQRTPVREADGHIIDLGEDEGDEIFFRSTSSRPRSGSSLGDSHGRPVPHVEQGTSISTLEVERQPNAQDVFLSLRNPTPTTWTVEDIFGPQTGGHHRPSGNDLVETMSSLGAVLDDVKADPHLLALHSSTTSASSGTTIDDTFSFTRKTARPATLGGGSCASHTLRLDAQTRHIRPQDQFRLSVPYGARPPTGFADHSTAGLASLTGSRVSANEESEKSSLENQSDAQQGASRQGSGAPWATGSGSDFSISELGRPGVGSKMFTSPVALESDTVSEPTIFPGVGTLIDPISVGAEGENSNGSHPETPLVSVDQNEQPQPSASSPSPSAPTSTSQRPPLMSLPQSSSRAMEVKPLELPLLEEQSMDLRAILTSGRKRLPGVQAKTRRRAVIRAPLIPQTDDEVEDTLDQSRGCEEPPMDMSSKHDSEQFDMEATSFSTVAIDSVVDKSRLKRPPPKARTRRQNWNKTPQKPMTSRSSGASKDKKKSKPTSVVRKTPNPNSPSLVKENRLRQGMQPTAHNRRRGITQSQMSVVREIIKELQEEAPELCYSPTPSHHSSASDYSLASPRRVPNSAVDIVGGTDKRIFKFGRYSTLRQEAEEEVNRSRYVWEDTPFSMYALNSFHPPSDRRQITEFLDYSQKTYISLPREYRRKNRHRLSSSKGYTSPRVPSSPLKRSTASQDRKRVPGSPLKRSTTSQDRKTRSVTVKISPSKSQGSPASVTVAKPPIFTKPTSSSVVHIRSKSNCPKNIFSPPRDAPSTSKQPTVARSSVKSRDTSKEISHETLNGESEAQGSLARAPDQPQLAKPRPRGRVTPLNNSRSKKAKPPPFRV